MTTPANVDACKRFKAVIDAIAAHKGKAVYYDADFGRCRIWAKLINKEEGEAVVFCEYHKKDDRIEFSSLRLATRTRREFCGPYDSQAPKITVSATRPTDDIIVDFDRRFWPAHQGFIGACHSARLKIEALDKKQDEAIQHLSITLDAPKPKNTHGHKSTLYPKNMGSIQVNRSENAQCVTIERFSATPTQTQAVYEIVNGIPNPAAFGIVLAIIAQGNPHTLIDIFDAAITAADQKEKEQAV